MRGGDCDLDRVTSRYVVSWLSRSNSNYRVAGSIEKIELIVVAIAGSHDVTDIAAVFEKATHRIPQEKPGHGLFAKDLLKLIPARDFRRLVQIPAGCHADEGSSACAYTLNWRRPGKLLYVNSGIGNLYCHGCPPLSYFRRHDQPGPGRQH